MADENEQVPGPAPWHDDLAAQFQDENVRAQVDEFLRAKVQPHVTRLEQATQPNRDAERLWTDFAERPQDTFLAVGTELYGEERARKMLEVLSAEADDPDNPTEDEIAQAASSTDLPPEVQEAIDYIQEKRTEEAWDTTYSQLKADNEDVEFHDELFYPFVSAADGDLDVATGMYKTWLEKAKTQFAPEIPENLTPEQEAAAAAAAPPPTISGGSGPVTPPQVSQPASLDDALDEWFAELKSAPPTV